MAEIRQDVIKVNETRIAKLREYLFTVIDELLTDNSYQIPKD